MKKQKFETLKTILALSIMMVCILYVSNSDFETYQLECQAGLRTCGK